MTLAKIIPMRILIIFIAIILLAGCSKKPQGRYVARVEAGTSRLEMSYDFRENGMATSWISSGRSIIPVKGKWQMDQGVILFKGEYTDPTTKEKKQVSHRLYFDGDDLFREDLILRFVKQGENRS